MSNRLVITFYHKHAKQFKAELGERFFRFNDDDTEDDYTHEMECATIFAKDNEKLLKKMRKVFEAEKDSKYSKRAKSGLRALENYEQIMTLGDKAKISTLTSLKTAIQNVAKTAHEKFFYRMNSENYLLPYRYDGCEYVNGNQDDATHVSIKLKYFDFQGDKGREVRETRISFYKDELEDKPTLAEIFEERKVMIGTEKHYAEYEQQLKDLRDVEKLVGHQFVGSGVCRYSRETSYSSWLSSGHQLSVGGNKNKLIIDYPEKIALVHTGSSNVPTHPFVRAYDITEHKQVFVATYQIEKYEYTSDIKDNLVLPKPSIDLLDVLIDKDVDLMDDIIAGKTGGIIVLGTGGPGLGKTLTAEVYSEIMERPLYVVQSSQLGINVEQLEKKLQMILDRAARWNAILMIDEADTYIHKRGTDIVQNCIVGVFLRLLEYYKGVLFMTSNLPEVVDDAILSRCTAHVHYDIPTKKDAVRIWKIQTELNKLKSSDKQFEEIIDAHPYLAGRDIKNMCKMMHLYLSKKDGEFGLSLFEQLLPFMNFSFKAKEYKKENKKS
jgi:hypothetical protein